jgi:crossover junction endodeoxyribonuclease RusA
MTTYGPCLHRPPSPGQSMCSCDHTRRELEFAAAIVERSRAEAVPPHCTIALEPPCDFINANSRLHHHAKAKLTKAWRDATRAQADVLSGGWTIPVHIVVSIRFPNNIRRDVGNYYPTAKAIVDGLVDAGVLPDDDDKHVVGPDNRREYPNGPARVTVTITPLEDE